MKIGIDIDDVLVEFLTHFLEYYKIHYDPSFDYDINSMEGYSLEGIFKIDLDKIHSLLDEYSLSSFSKDIPVSEGVSESLKKLSEEHELIFITARPNSIMDQTKKDVQRVFPSDTLNIFHSSDKYRNVIKSKANICLDEGVEIMVDDNLDFLLECSEKGINCLLFDRPWNKNFDESLHKNIVRVKNWDEIMENLK